MRLINTASLEIEEFRGADRPPYAILSHTWGSYEASFQDWTKRWTRLRKSRAAGFSKILSTCKLARRDGLRYAWIDTVCIDKSSSAELSEAINSMYAWYEKAKICYVYLSDVPDQAVDQTEPLDFMRRSRWFTRGWTLQELLAPSNVVFYSQGWTEIGTKNALAVLISEVTQIDRQCLHKRKRLREFSIAQRMGWAANRSTTREEDVAYCLLGIFNINMPLLYGEGQKAFRRLQEEIIKVEDDHSILAFDSNLSEETLFAHHPIAFQRSSQIHPNFALRITAPFSMTNAGLSIATPLIQTLSPFWVLALLNCVEVRAEAKMKRAQICLPLFGKESRYMRARFPVSLICKKLDDDSVSVRDEIQDLTTRNESSYFISYFARIYSVYAREMDEALKGFGIDSRPGPSTGFMITFPRGMANYRLYAAYPPADLRADISFFLPTTHVQGPPAKGDVSDDTQRPGESRRPRISGSLDTSQPNGSKESQPAADDPEAETPITYSGGLIVFRDDSCHPPQITTAYLCLKLDKPLKVIDWVCRLIPTPANFRVADLEGMKARADQADTANEPPHYHQSGNAIVAARTRFKTLVGEPCYEAIMVEIVFDYESLRLEDQ